MNLNLNEEQRLLRDGAERFIAENCRGDRYRRVVHDPAGFDPETWRQFAELGWLALPIDVEYGGIGCGAVEIAILMEAFGKGLVCEPYLSTVVLGAGLVHRCGTEAQRRTVLPRVAAGDLLLAVAHGESDARFDLSKVETIAQKTGEGWRLNGAKAAVLDGCAAGMLVVSARIRTSLDSPNGIGLFLVSSVSPGLAMRDFPRLGGGRVSQIEFVDVLVPSDALLGDEADALPDIQWAFDRALAALCAEAAGLMQRLVDMTRDYTQVREQFGRPLSDNQVIRHRLADMAVRCDEARAVALRAALMVDAAPLDRVRAAAGAKAKVGRCARLVGEEAIQLHGAMGVTEELEVGSYFKRLVAIDTLFGGSAYHYRRHAELSGSAAAV